MSDLVRATRKPFVTVGTSEADYIVSGTSDNTQIQAAINFVSGLGGGVVHLKPANYDIRSGITIPDNMTLVGTRKSILKRNVLMTSGKIITNSDLASGNTGIRIQGIKIDGSSDLVTAVDGMESIRLDKCVNCKVIDVEAINSPSEGIQFHSALNCHVIQCTVNGTVTILGSKKAGIIFSGPTDGSAPSIDCSIQGCHTQDTAGEGISSYYSNGIRLINNTIYWTTGAANASEILIEQSDNVQCIGNTITANLDGIVCLSSTRINLSSNTIKLAKEHGISVEGASRDVSIANNLIYNAQNHGINLQDTARNISISGNKIVDAGQAANATYYAINLDPNGGYLRRLSIVGNHAYATASNKILSFIGTTTDTSNRITDLYEDGNFSEGQTGPFITIDNTSFVEILNNKLYLTVGPTSDCDYITDGTADDVQIQQALDKINTAGGGTLFVPNSTYNLTAKLTIGSNTEVIGENKTKTILKMGASQNKHVFENKDTTNGNSYISIKNLTVDQNGANQASGGNGIHFQGITDSILENIVVEKSYSFNVFIHSVTGTALTGTLTFTNGDTTVTGSSTSFTTELSVGSIIKSNGGNFQRVHSITSNTSLELDRAWGWATESGVSAKLIPANSRNRIINCRFKGNDDNDNVGLGLFDDSLIQGCISHNANGYGFGPDHANRVKFIGNTCYSNVNGIGIETCGHSVFQGNVCYGNSQNGLYLLAGSYRNTLSSNVCRDNGSSGINVSYNSTSSPKPDENSLIGNLCEINDVHGIRIGGASRTIVSNNRCINNDQNGIVTVTENSVVPVKTLIIGNHCYDNQDTKTQDRGIYILNGTDTVVTDNMSLTVDHNTAGLTDSGTNTVITNTDTHITSSGVYTPTRSAEANMDANVTMTEAQYMRVGKVVTVSGRFTADPTVTATTASFEMTLPIASNIGAAEDVAGVAFCGNIAAQGAEIIGVAANDTAKVQWKSTDVTSQVWSYTYSYQII